MTKDWRESDGRNVFEMIRDGGGPGIWVRRVTWDATCARIVAIGEVTKPPPYYGNPTVLMDVYSLGGQLRDELAQLDTAGTYKTWREIDPPAWASTVPLRPLDDPSIGQELAAQDKKRVKFNEKLPEQRVELNVPFSRKDEAKAIGARWDPNGKKWWLPAKGSEEAQAKARKLRFLP